MSYTTNGFDETGVVFPDTYPRYAATWGMQTGVSYTYYTGNFSVDIIVRSASAKSSLLNT